MKKIKLIFVVLVMVILSSNIVFATDYYVSNSGYDTDDGLTPETAWSSLGRVNTAEFNNGDRVRFQADGLWRGQLIPQSGIVYTSYDNGTMPKIFGSTEKNKETNWKREGDYWVIDFTPTTGENLLGSVNWYLYDSEETDASATSTAEEFSIACTQNGSTKQTIQFFTTDGMNIEAETWYKFTFSAKSDVAFSLGASQDELKDVTLMENGGSYGTCYKEVKIREMDLSTEYKTFEVFFLANQTTANARITFYLGTMPSESTLSIKRDMSLYECEMSNTPYGVNKDVGNIIFNNSFCGWKKWSKEDLTTQGDFYYDPVKKNIFLYSNGNPTVIYSDDIEVAISENIIHIEGIDDVVIENLNIRYGGAHGVYVTESSDIKVKNCIMKYIGGGEQPGAPGVRYGNPFEAWGNVSHITVSGCIIGEGYDAGITNHCHIDDVTQHHIYFENNIIYNCEYGYEFTMTGENSAVNDIYIRNNTIINSGYGWSWEQRPESEQRGVAIISFGNIATLGNPFSFVVSNNILYNSKGSLLFFNPYQFNGLDEVIIDNNCYYKEGGGTIITDIDEFIYTAEDFALWQEDSGKDANSIATDPLFVDIDNLDVSLSDTSPCLLKNMGHSGNPDLGVDSGSDDSDDSNPDDGGTVTDDDEDSNDNNDPDSGDDDSGSDDGGDTVVDDDSGSNGDDGIVTDDGSNSDDDGDTVVDGDESEDPEIENLLKDASWELFSATYLNGNGSEQKKATLANENSEFVIACAKTSTAKQDNQFLATDISIKNETWYKFSFSAKSSIDFSLGNPEDELSDITLMQNGGDYDKYYQKIIIKPMNFTGEYQTFEVLFLANQTAEDARINMYLGTMPSNTILKIKDMYLQECVIDENGNIVGNIDSEAISVTGSEEKKKGGSSGGCFIMSIY